MPTVESSSTTGSGTIMPSTSGQPTPADQIPSLKPIIIERRELPSDATSFSKPAPTEFQQDSVPGVRPIQDPNPSMRWDNQPVSRPEPDDLTALADPTRERFEYNPVRLANYTQTVHEPAVNSPVQGEVYHGRVQIAPGELAAQPETHSTAPASSVNSRWTTSNW